MAKYPLCPWCGAESPKRCEMEENAGYCPWEDEELEEPDPDILREDRDERERAESFFLPASKGEG